MNSVRATVRFLFQTFLFLLLAAGGNVHAENLLRVALNPEVIRQGDVGWIRVWGPPSLASAYGEFQGMKWPMGFSAQDQNFQGLLGIDLDIRPGIYEIKVIAKGRDDRVYWAPLRVSVEKTDFMTQTLSLPPSMVDLDAKTLERVKEETKRLESLFRGFRDERIWQGPFIRPVAGEVTSAFGIRRIINRQPKSPHGGVDLRGDEGTPVLAANGGVVVLVDDFFFSGKSVVLDHGWGLFSMYGHLSAALVREGNRVPPGALIGRVGSTGRSTAPHLHWGIRLNGARVDPLALLRLTENMKD